jgi:hypothetical protein
MLAVDIYAKAVATDKSDFYKTLVGSVLLYYGTVGR